MPTPRKYASDADRQRAFRERRKRAIADELARKGLPPVPVLSTVPGERRWAALIEQARASLQTVCEEMQAYYDDRSEQWQESERAAAMQERKDAIEGILADLDALPES